MTPLLPAPRIAGLLPAPLILKAAPRFVGQKRLWVTTAAGTFSVDPARLGEALRLIAGLEPDAPRRAG